MLFNVLLDVAVLVSGLRSIAIGVGVGVGLLCLILSDVAVLVSGLTCCSTSF